MAFTSITDPIIGRDGADLLVSWPSASTPGPYQVYVDGKLAWHGNSLAAHLPWPSRRMSIEVGSVDAGEERTDFSADLPAPPGGGNRVKLAWQGGQFEGADLQGFRIYKSASPGGPVDYSAVLADIAAYPQGLITGGFGSGGFGAVPFGSDICSFVYESDPLPSGTWTFAVRPYDSAGNDGTAVTYAATIAAPPRPPAADSDGNRLAYAFDGSKVTLTWTASPV